MWVLAHQRDLWADFRAFYHLSPAEALELPGPEYLALAWRTPAYDGVMTARLQEQEHPDRSGWGDEKKARAVPLGSMTGVAPDADGLPLADLFD